MRKTQYDKQTMTNAPTVILNGVFAVQIVVTAAAPYVTWCFNFFTCSPFHDAKERKKNAKIQIQKKMATVLELAAM